MQVAPFTGTILALFTGAVSVLQNRKGQVFHREAKRHSLALIHTAELFSPLKHHGCNQTVCLEQSFVSSVTCPVPVALLARMPVGVDQNPVRQLSRKGGVWPGGCTR